MSDPRPLPKYGEYAPVPPVDPGVVPPVPPIDLAVAPLVTDQPAAAPGTGGTPGTRRTWDVVLTAVLLLFGVWDVVTGYPRFAELDVALRSAYEDQGIGAFTADTLATTMGLVINIGRVVLLVVAIVVSLRLIARRRLSFWAPLGAGVIAGLFVVVCILVVVLRDPALADYAMQQVGTP